MTRMVPGNTAPTFPSAPLPPYLDDGVGTCTVSVLFILLQSYQFFHDRIDREFDCVLCCRRVSSHNSCFSTRTYVFLIICVLLPSFPSLFVLAGYCEAGSCPVSSFIDASLSSRDILAASCRWNLRHLPRNARSCAHRRLAP